MTGPLSHAEDQTLPDRVSFEEIIRQGKLETFKTDRGLERSDLAADYLLLKAEEAVAAGRFSDAVRLGDMAATFSPDSPLPRFFLSQAYWHQNKTDLPNVVSEYFIGLHLALKDFWFSFSIIGTVFLLILFALLLSLLTFLAYSVFSYVPLWIHQISEVSRGYLYPVSTVLLFISMFFIPVLLGLPVLWFLLFLFLIFWGFYRSAEKGVALIFLAVIGAMPWILPIMTNFFTAKGSVFLNQMVRNQQRDFFWSAPFVEGDRSDWKALFINASYEVQQGNYERAAVLYQRALAGNPGSERVLNNLGNLFFYVKDYPRAIDAYQKALTVAPQLVSSRYNMSQTYREMLSFDEGNRIYTEAAAVDLKKVQDYAQKTTQYPAFPVIEERFTRLDLWREVWQPDIVRSEKIWQGWAGSMSLKQAPVIVISWTLLLFIFSYLFGGFYTARFCTTCHRAICKKCQQNILTYKLCDRCGLKFKSIKKKSEFAALEEAGDNVPTQMYPLFLLPGGGHLAIGRTKAGFFFLMFFYFSVGYWFFGQIFYTSAQWHLKSSAGIWVPGSIALLYIVYVLDLLHSWSKRPWH